MLPLYGSALLRAMRHAFRRGFRRLTWGRTQTDLSLACEPLEPRNLLAVLAYDGFEDYAAGVGLEDAADVGLNGGSGWTNEWAVRDNARRADVTIASDGLSFNNSTFDIDGGDRALQYAATDTEATGIIFRQFGATASETIYLSFLYQNSADVGSVSASSNDFIQIGLDNNNDANPLISALDRNTEFQLRSTSGSGVNAPTGITSAVGETYLVVLKATKTGANPTYNQIELFVNPDSLTEPGTANAITTVDSGLNLSTSAFFALHKAFQENGDTYLVDEIRIGETWNDALGIVHWDGGGDGVHWNVAANWSNDLVPTAANIVVFDDADAGTIEVDDPEVVRQILLTNTTGNNITFQGAGSLSATRLIQSGTGSNTLDLRFNSTDLTASIDAGTLSLTDVTNAITAGTWTVEAGATLQATANGTSSALGQADLEVNDGTLAIEAVAANTWSNALGHFGYHVSSNTFMDLNNNGGMLNGGNPFTFSDFEGAGLLTSGPGNRGLDFDNDANFRAALANIADDPSGDGRVIDQNDNYSNLFFGTLTVSAAEAGVWSFRRNADDDAVGIWIDLDQDGVFESSTPGLGSNRGEQLQWDGDAGTKNVMLAAGTYRVAFTHREGTGGSNIDIQVKSPTMPALETIKPTATNQNGFWNFSIAGSVDLSNAVVASGNASFEVRYSSTVAPGRVELGALTVANGAVLETNAPSWAFESVTIDGSATFDTEAESSFVLGAITELSANSSVTTSGAGTVVFDADNDYSGLTTVGSGSTLEVRNAGGLGSNSVGTLVENAGSLLLNAGNATFSETLTLNGDGNANSDGALHSVGGNVDYNGAVTLGSNATIRKEGGGDLEFRGGIDTAGFEARFEAVNTIRVFDNAITGSGSVRKEESGTLEMRVNNSYTGTTVINDGVIDVNVTQGLGTTASGTTINGNGTLRLRGNVSIAENLVLNNGDGEGGQGVLRNDADNNTLTGTITVNGTPRITVDSGTTLTLDGLVNGGGGFDKRDPGTLVLSQTNTYGGVTTVEGGTIVVAANGALGTAAGGTTLNPNTTVIFDFAGDYTSAENFTLWSGSTLANRNFDKALASANIALVGDAMFDSVTAGTTFSTGAAIDLGISNLTVVGNGDTVLSGTVSSAAFVDDGTGVFATPGLIETVYDINSVDNPFAAAILATSTQLGPRAGYFTNNQGPWGIDGTDETIVYRGQFYDADGIFSFAEQIDDGVLIQIDGVTVLRNTSWNQATSTAITNGLNSNGGVGGNANPNGGTTQFGTGGWYDFEVRFANGGGGEGAQNVQGWTTTFGFGLANPATSDPDLLPGVDGSAGGNHSELVGNNAAWVRAEDPGDASLFRITLAGRAGVVKQGTGTLTLSGDNTYDGVTDVQAGTLLLNNTSGSATGSTDSNIIVAAGATLGGNGSTDDAVSLAGTLSPGNSPGVLTTGDFDFVDNSNYVVEIGGPTAGVGAGFHDLLIADAVTIGNSVALDLSSFGGYVPVVGDSFTLIDADSVTGTFDGYAEGHTFTNFLGSGFDAVLTYSGGDGGDVVITVYGAGIFIWDGDAGDLDWRNELNWDRDSGIPDLDTQIAIFDSLAPSSSIPSETIDLGGNLTLGELRFENAAGNDFTITGGTLTIGAITQTGTGVNVIDARLDASGVAGFVGSVSAGSLTLSDASNLFDASDDTWTVNTGGTLVVSAAGTISSLGLADVVLNGGTLDINADPGHIANALDHFGFHTDTQGLLDLNNNDGLLNNFNPTTANNFEGHGLLTNGPGSRGLDFDNDTDFRSVPALIQDDVSGDGFVIDRNDNYSNLWIGYFTPDVTGNWEFRRNADDDQVGIWFDRDDDGVFESSTVGLGSNSNEQLQWDGDGGWKSVSLVAGESYLIAFTHREGTGGSQADFRFRGPAGAAINSETIIKPGDPAQAGYFSTAFAQLPQNASLGNAVTLTGTGSTVEVESQIDFASLTTTSAALQLNVVDDNGQGTLEFQTTTLGGDTTVNTVNEATVTLNNISETTPSALTATGDGTVVLPTTNTYTGLTTVTGTATLEIQNSNALGTTGVGTVVQNGASLRLVGSMTVDETLTINGGGSPNSDGALHSVGGNVDYDGAVTLGSNATIRKEGGGDLEFRGGIDTAGFEVRFEAVDTIRVFDNGITGSGSVRKTEDGTLELRVDSNYSGTTVIENGTIDISTASSLGTTSGGTTVNNGATLRLRGNISVAEAISLNGAGEGNQGALRNDDNSNTLTGAVTLAGTSQIDVDAGTTLTITGPIGGGSGNRLEKVDTGTLVLSGVNTYDGLTIVNAGVLRVASSAGLGSAANGTAIRDGAAVEITGGITLADDFFVSGRGIASGGVLRSTSGDNILTGDVISGGATDIGLTVVADSLTVDGDVDLGLANLWLDGAGNLIVNGVVSGGADGMTPGGLIGSFIDIDDPTDLVGNRTSNGSLLFQQLAPFQPDGASDFVLQRLGMTPTGDAANVIVPRVDFGGGTQTTQGNGSVLDRGDFSSGTIPPWQGLFNDLGLTADMDGDQIAVTFSGRILITTAGNYTFTTRSDDGSVLFIDGQLVVNNNKNQGMTNRSGTINLSAGFHTISVGFYEGGSGAGVQASYSGADTGNTRVIIPPSVLYNDVATPGTFVSGGLRGNFYDLNNSGSNGGFNLTTDEWLLFGTAPTDVVVLQSLSRAATAPVTMIDFGIGTEFALGDGSVLDRGFTNDNPYGGVGVNIGNDQLGAVFEGYLLVPETADYRFTTRSDDNSRVYVDLNNDGDFSDLGELVVGTDSANATTTGATVSLTAGSYRFLAVTGEGTGGAMFQVSWQQLTGTNPFARQLITPEYFSANITSQVTKNGTGTVTFTGANRYVSNTIVNDGVLLVNNAAGSGTGSGDVTINGPAVFAGSGAVTGSVTTTASATVSPGVGTGTTAVLETGSLNIADDELDVELLGGTPGTQHDQLVVTGGVNVTNANLNILAIDTGNLTAGTQILLIDNDTNADAVIGTFSGLAEGAVFDVLGVTFQITYQGGDGNDVVLTSFGEAETLVTLEAGKLVIEDINKTTDDGLTITFDSGTSEYVITDPNAALTTDIAGATRPNGNTVRVAAALVTDGVELRTLDGNDTVTWSGSFTLTGDLVFNSADRVIIPTGTTLDVSGNDIVWLAGTNGLDMTGGSVTNLGAITETGGTNTIWLEAGTLGTASTDITVDDLFINSDHTPGTADFTYVRSGGTLQVNNNLQLGGEVDSAANSRGTLTQNGTAIVNIGNDMVFGGAAGREGGTYNLDAGSLTVGGDIIETTANVDSAQLHLDGGTIDVTGDITVQRFAVAQDGGTSFSYTIKSGQTVTSTGTTAVGSNGTGTLIFADSTATLISGNAVVGEGANGDGTVLMENGGNWSVGSYLYVGVNGTGAVTLDDTSSLLTVGNRLDVARQNNADGTINLLRGTIDVNGGGMFLAGGGDLAANLHPNTTAELIVGVAGGSATDARLFTSGANFEVGRAGTATVTQESGTVTIENNNLILGQGGAAEGTYTINDGTLITSVGQIRVGNTGRGTIHQYGGVVTSTNTLDLGNVGAATSIGEYNLIDGELNALLGLELATVAGATGTLIIGDGGSTPILNVSGGNFETALNGIGTVTMNSGTFNQTTNNLIVGQGAASNGTFIVNGGLLDVENQIRIANNGTGAFTLNNGTVNVGTALDLVNAASAVLGTLTVNNGILNVGDRVAGNLIAGNFSATGAEARIQINGGTVDVNGNLFVGNANDSSVSSLVEILGGQVTTNGVRIANNGASSSGTLIVGDGTSMPMVTVEGQFEAADDGTGQFELRSGTVTLTNGNFITGQVVGSSATVIVGGYTSAATLNLDGGDGNRDWNVNSGNGMVTVLTQGTINVGRDMNLGNNTNAASGLALTINGGAVHLGTAAGNVGNLTYRNNGPTDQISLQSGVLSSAGGTIDLSDAADAQFSFTGGTLEGFAVFTNGILTQDLTDSASLLRIGQAGAVSQMTAAGGYTLSGGALEIDIDGTAGAGIAGGHDVLIVNENVVLDPTDATLAVNLNFAPSVGQFFVIIDNPGANAVSGTFADSFGDPLLDGETLFIGGVAFEIDYNFDAATGTRNAGNDVALIVDDSPIIEGTDLDDEFHVYLDAISGNLIVTVTTEGVPEAAPRINLPTSQIEQLIIRGRGGDDTVIIDYVNGDPLAGLNSAGNAEIVFEGGETLENGIADDGTNPGDSLRLVNGSADNVAYTIHAGGGRVVVDTDAVDGLTGTIDFVETEGTRPIEDELTVAVRSFTFTAGNETITVQDFGTTVDGLNLIGTNAGPAQQSVQFGNPSQSLFVLLTGGTDTLTIDGIDSGFAAALAGVVSNGTLNLNAALPTGLPRLDLVADTIHLNNGGQETTGGQRFFGSVILGADTTLTASHVDFLGAIDSDAMARSLSLLVSGDTVFAGDVGQNSALTSLTTDAAGRTLFLETGGLAAGAAQDFDAANDSNTGNTLWEDTLSGYTWNYGGSNITLVNGPSSLLAGITDAYRFPGSSDSNLERMTGDTYQNITGNPSDESFSFEWWLRPDSLDIASGQIVWETGGAGNGASLILVPGATPGSLVARFTIKTGTDALVVEGDIEQDFDFSHLVVTFDLNASGGTDVLRLYIDGHLVATSSGNADDWDGGGGAGLGGRNTDAGAHNNSGVVDNNYNALGSFSGDIARMRFFTGQVLTDTEVLLDYATTVLGTSSGPRKVETIGDQHYADAVVTNSDLTLMSQTGEVIVDAGLSGQDADESLTIEGQLDLNSALSGIVDLTVTGEAELDTPVVQTSGNQTYVGPVLLVQNLTLISGNNVEFVDTVDSASGANSSLTVQAPGATTFRGNIGQTDALLDLTTDMPGTTVFPGAVGVTSGALLNFDAGLDTDGDGTFESTTGEQGLNFTIPGGLGGAAGITQNLSPTTAYPGITGSFVFTDPRAASGNDRMSNGDHQNFPGDLTNDSFTVELWLRPQTLALGTGQIVYETGGSGDGMSLILEPDGSGGAQLRFLIKDGNENVSVIAPITQNTEFTQVVVTYDPNTPNPTDTLRIFIDGILVDTSRGTLIDDWSGNNGGGLGGRNSDAGGRGANGENLDLLDDYRGEIAILRFYTNQVLDTGDVHRNFLAVTQTAPTIVTTIGDQTYGDHVLIDTDVILNGNDVTFQKQIDSPTSEGSLTVNADGTTIFRQSVGTAGKLASLTTDAAGQTILGGDVMNAEATLAWDAELDTTNNGLWEELGANAAFAWGLGTNVTKVTVVGSAFSGLTSVYDFPASGTDNASDKATTTTWENLAVSGTNVTNQSFSFEWWLRPDSLTGGDQVIWETGGATDGASLVLIGGNTLRMTVKDDGNFASAEVMLTAADLVDFIQVVATFDESTGTVSLTVKSLAGSQTATGSSGGIADWAGAGTSGLGGRNGDTGGHNASGSLNFGTFAGQIAQMRYYRDRVLTGEEIDAYFQSILAGKDSPISVNTTGDQFYGDIVSLESDVAIMATNTTFDSTVDSDPAGNSLTVNSTGGGTTTLHGEVGGTGSLGNLTTNADGSTVLNADVTTTGNQLYGDLVLLDSDVTATGFGITFSDALNSINGELNGLTILADNLNFLGDVGLGSNGVLGHLDTTTDQGLTIGVNILVQDQISFIVNESADTDEDFTLTSGAMVQSLAGTMDVNVGDDIDIQAGTLLQAAGSLTLSADLNGDAGVGASVVIEGSLVSDTAGVTLNTGNDADQIRYNDLRAGTVALTINSAGGDDVIGLIGSPDGSAIVNAGDGADLLSVGSDSDSLDTISFAVTFNAGSGNDTLTLRDSGDADGNTYELTATTFDRNGTGLPLVSYFDNETLNLLAGAGADTMTVLGIADGTVANLDLAAGGDIANIFASGAGSMTNLTTAGGQDFVRLGNPNGLLDEIAGTINLDGGVETDLLLVDDSGDATDNLGSLTDGTLTGLGLGEVVNYGNFEALSVALGSGSDRLTVFSTAPGTFTAVNSGAGDDTLALAIDDPAKRIVLSVSDPSGSDTLNFEASMATTIDLDETSAQTVNARGDTLTMNNPFENFTGSVDADTVFVDLLPGVPRLIEGQPPIGFGAPDLNGNFPSGDTLFVDTFGFAFGQTRSGGDGSVIGEFGANNLAPLNFTSIEQLIFQNQLDLRGLPTNQIPFADSDNGFVGIPVNGTPDRFGQELSPNPDGDQFRARGGDLIDGDAEAFVLVVVRLTADGTSVPAFRVSGSTLKEAVAALGKLDLPEGDLRVVLQAGETTVAVPLPKPDEAPGQFSDEQLDEISEALEDALLEAEADLDSNASLPNEAIGGMFAAAALWRLLRPRRQRNWAEEVERLMERM
jgi:autotransporter-associated beta strand protein